MQSYTRQMVGVVSRNQQGTVNEKVNFRHQMMDDGVLSGSGISHVTIVHRSRVLPELPVYEEESRSTRVLTLWVD